MNVFLNGLQQNDLQMMQIITKIIAHAVRNGMEDFHVEYPSDDQMKELNPLIRKAVYNSLFALANSDRDLSSQEFIDWHLKSIPDYREDAQLSPTFLKSHNVLLGKKISFNSDFLNEQYALGNIFFEPHMFCIRLRGSFEFKDIPYSEERNSNLKSLIIYEKKAMFMTTQKTGM